MKKVYVIRVEFYKGIERINERKVKFNEGYTNHKLAEEAILSKIKPENLKIEENEYLDLENEIAYKIVEVKIYDSFLKRFE